MVLSSVFHLTEDADAVPSTAADATAEIQRLIQDKKLQRQFQSIALQQEMLYAVPAKPKEEPAEPDVVKAEPEYDEPEEPKHDEPEEPAEPEEVQSRPTEEELRARKLRRVGNRPMKEDPGAKPRCKYPVALPPPAPLPKAKFGIKLKAKAKCGIKQRKAAPVLRGSVASMAVADEGMGLNIVFSICGIWFGIQMSGPDKSSHLKKYVCEM